MTVTVQLPSNVEQAYLAAAKEMGVSLDTLVSDVLLSNVPVTNPPSAPKLIEENGIVGGTLYDALIAACALQSAADRIYRWNTKHFQRLGPQVAARLTTPSTEFLAAIKGASRLTITGGAVYDALIAPASKAQADRDRRSLCAETGSRYFCLASLAEAVQDGEAAQGHQTDAGWLGYFPDVDRQRIGGQGIHVLPRGEAQRVNCPIVPLCGGVDRQSGGIAPIRPDQGRACGRRTHSD
jgi:hypothetical protein